MTSQETKAMELGGWKTLKMMAGYMGVNTRTVYAMASRGELERSRGLTRTFYRVNQAYKGPTRAKTVSNRHRRIQAVFNLKAAQLELGLL